MIYTKELVDNAAKDSQSKADMCRKLGLHENGACRRKLHSLIEQYNIDISHFDGGISKNIKWKVIDKECPVCGNIFKSQLNHPREKTTCSHSCSNTYFRTGRKNGSYLHGYSSSYKTEYRAVCFTKYEHKCALCDWNKVVEVHHIDGNNKNHSIENLIPLCPNHHRLTICLNYKDAIEKEIIKWKLENP